ncbi:MAG: hypothetical protein KAX49_18990 [Halanaerobiales bacterium]|nr:hypothetical protein [Halanaerobiales bacterium]
MFIIIWVKSTPYLNFGGDYFEYKDETLFALLKIQLENNLKTIVVNDYDFNIFDVFLNKMGVRFIIKGRVDMDCFNIGLFMT